MDRRGSVRKLARRTGALVGSGVLLAGFAVGPVAASTRLVDSTGPGWAHGGSQVAATVDSDPASRAESSGVALIDTELYSGAAAAGTGIVLTASGRVLTNYHVVEDSTDIRVTIATTGQTYDATLVGADEESDIAVLQLADASGLTTAELDDDQVDIGDDVTAVGNSGGTSTLYAADGEVTALDQQITASSQGSADGDPLYGLIETDADVVAGDSGGPLIDDEGEVIGVDTAASTGADIRGYAIPIDDAMAIVDKINSGTETQQVRIGPAPYLGVQVQDRRLGGAAVLGVEEGSPAAEAGLGAGDIINRIGETMITSSADLTEALADYQPGEQVTIGWLDASGEQQTATVALGPSPVN